MPRHKLTQHKGQAKKQANTPYKEHPKHEARKQLKAANYKAKIRKSNYNVNNQDEAGYIPIPHQAKVHWLFRLILISAAIHQMGNLLPTANAQPVPHRAKRNTTSHNSMQNSTQSTTNCSVGCETPIKSNPNSTDPNLSINDQNNCTVARLAFDIGSGGTKVKGAIINICAGTQEEIYSQQYAIKYRADLDKSADNTFSDKIQQEGLKAITHAQQEFQDKVAQEYPQLTIESCGIATAAFRSAGNGEAVAEKFSTILNMPIDILSQQEEGKIAYQAALGKAQANKQTLNDPIVWDIGGGSMQFSHWDRDSDTFTMCGSEVASQTVFKLITSNIPTCNTVVGTDFSDKQVHQAVKLIYDAFPAGDPACEKIVNNIKNGSDVVAVGSFHTLGIKPLVNGALQSDKDGFSKADVLGTFAKLLAQKATPENILKYNPKLMKDFAPNQAVDLLLTGTTMNKMGIAQANTMQINNADGLLFHGCPWRAAKTIENEESVNDITTTLRNTKLV
ncbi:MAG: hypothetical protein JSS07_04865 [Proteobacteria bacterium]|nr:hypothetical protein [Pseudomonadota bacterium]